MHRHGGDDEIKNLLLVEILTVVYLVAGCKYEEELEITAVFGHAGAHLFHVDVSMTIH